MPEVTVVRSQDRYLTRAEGITTRHCFSYGDHYDPANTGFGPLRAVNEEVLEPGAGYDAHHHSDVEIVTWVLDGTLAHEDSAGNRGVVRPGQVQHVSTGRGIEHTERNASDAEPLRFVQMMVEPSAVQLAADPEPPSYELHDVEGARGLLLPVVRLRPGVALHVALLEAGDAVALPDADLHVHVTRGSVDLPGGGLMGAGDTARITGARGVRVTSVVPSETLVWAITPRPPHDSAT